MVNPFDRTFFRFLFGFAFILLVSFAILYFVGHYSTAVDHEAAAILQ
jgi:hypothetical protein